MFPLPFKPPVVPPAAATSVRAIPLRLRVAYLFRVISPPIENAEPISPKVEVPVVTVPSPTASRPICRPELSVPPVPVAYRKVVLGAMVPLVLVPRLLVWALAVAVRTSEPTEFKPILTWVFVCAKL